MKKILVPTDFSTCAENAAKVAADLAIKSGAKVHLFHVFYTPLDLDWTNLPDQMGNLYPETNRQIEQVRLKLAKLANSEVFKNVEVDWTLKVNVDIVTAINEAYANNIDLIVMGTKGTGNWSNWLLGSNTQKIVRLAYCPILAVPENIANFNPKKIVVASDFSEPHNELPTIKQVLDIAYWFDAEVNLLKVIRPDDVPEFNTGHWKDLVEYGVAEVDTVKLDVFETVEEGILMYAEKQNADMIVMETHGRKGFMRFIMGNLSELIVNKAKVPVFVTRKPVTT